MSSIIHFNKEKYLRMAESIGVSATLTRLHEDIREWEYDSFEGEKGYQPKMIEELEVIRQFSRELWAKALNELAPDPKNLSSKP